MAPDAAPFMLRGGPVQQQGISAPNLNECALLSKRPASDATGILAGLTDFADNTVPGQAFVLSGPSGALRDDRLPVRGDLAHIRLAGKVFVPHYVVPMAHVIGGAGAVLRRAGKPDGEPMEELAAGTVFNLLDTAGDWAWGQVGDAGLVGYVPIDALKAAA